jgi:hypothetical protein
MEVRTPDYAPKRDAYRNEKRDSYLREFCFIDPAFSRPNSATTRTG